MVFLPLFLKLVLLLLLGKEHLPISIKRFETFRVAIGFNIKLSFLRRNKNHIRPEAHVLLYPLMAPLQNG